MTRIRRLSTVLVVAFLAGACGASGDEDADVCRDLRSLRATFQLILAPPRGATVGEVRGGLEKVAPVLDRAAASDATGASLDDAIRDAVEAFRDGLDGLGDDEPASLADAGLAGARAGMADSVEAAGSSLGCAA